MKVVATLLLLVASSLAGDMVSVSTNSPVGALIGASVVLTCNFSTANMQFGDQVEWVKNATLLTYNGEVAAAWTGTFRVTFDPNVNKTSILQMTAALSLADTYTCKLKRVCASCTDSQSSISLAIYGQPISIAWQRTENGTIALTTAHADPLNLVVQAFQSSASFVRIQLGTNDITSEFKLSSVNLTQGVYTSYYESPNHVSTNVDDGSTLNATVSIPLSPVISDMAKVALLSAPIVDCPQLELLRIGSRATVQCTVRGVPPTYSFQWTRVGDNEWFLDGNSSETGFISAVSAREVSSVNVIMTVLTVTRENLGTYHLSATNSKGTGMDTVLLQEDTTPTQKPASSSSKCVASLASVVAMAAILVELRKVL